MKKFSDNNRSGRAAKLAFEIYFSLSLVSLTITTENILNILAVIGNFGICAVLSRCFEWESKVNNKTIK